MPRTSKTRPTSRLSLDVTELGRERLESLRHLTEADSLSEVFRRAVAFYDLLIKEKQLGNRILVERDGQTSELIIV